MRVPLQNIDGPHKNSFILVESLTDTPKGAIILLHGRGATAENILGLGKSIDIHGNYTYIAPQAIDNQWYPYRFMEPQEKNEPHLSSALQVVDAAIEYILTEGFSNKEIFIGGFSQGACLAAEYLAQNPNRYGGAFILSGGLIGKTITIDYEGDLQNTPIFIGCGTEDFHIPVERVEQTAKVFRNLNGKVTLQLYKNMPHTITANEIATVQQLFKFVAQS